MLKSIGIIGYGIVGKGCHKLFEHNTEVIIIDPKYSPLQIIDLKENPPLVIFVAVNAPTLQDNSVDASNVYNVFQQLADIGYKGIVVLKSTLPPDIVEDLYVKFGKDSVCKKEGPLRYIYSPEFLREHYWEKDALSPSMIIMAGNLFDCDELKIIYTRHSHIKTYRKFFITDYRMASLVKYTINAFLATKVTFMNQVYQLYIDSCKPSIPHHGWEEFIEMLSTDMRIGTSHMNVPGPDGSFGFGGTCFPKDVSAFIGCDTNERLSVLREVSEANVKIRLQNSIDTSNGT